MHNITVSRSDAEKRFQLFFKVKNLSIKQVLKNVHFGSNTFDRDLLKKNRQRKYNPTLKQIKQNPVLIGENISY